ncbi:MAG: fused MFS/spermidine synthase [Burkholderiales bacterium]|jgi:spermidine synthase|nr:fused MFS/spermidine synthase [Burkholderiales bacterium]
MATYKNSGMLLLALLPIMPLVFALQAPQALAGDAVLYEKASAYGTVVITDEGNNMRALRFGRDGVRQSLVKLDDPEYLGLGYTPVALTGLALCNEQARRFLVIGLGGGTLPAFLRTHYPDAEIDAVDINPEVAFAAKNHLGFREDERMRIHIADGRKFIETVRQPYDAIFLDAFGADAVPAHLTTREFLSAVRRAVRSDGVVIGNIWFTATSPPYDSMVRTYRETFGELHVLRVAGTHNRILYALPRSQPLARSDLASMARKLAIAKNFRFSPGPLVERGLLSADLAAFGGKVLTDANVGQ